MKTKIFLVVLLLLSLLLFFFFFLSPPRAKEQRVVVGYFPNITHAHALIAQNMAATGEGWFEKRLPGIRIEWQSFNAGPSAMEALLAKSIDVTFVGPSPALNAFIRSKGKDVRVLSGAVRGGAGLVIRKDEPLKTAFDFKGKRIATPQLGNTQDIACRHWFKQAGLNVTLTGGDVQIIPTSNPDMLTLFVNGDIEAAWTVEPWISRLEMQGDGKLLYLEPISTSITTVLVSGNSFLTEHPDRVKQFVKANEELTEWIKQHPEEAKKRVADELTRQMKREFPSELVERAWPRMVFDDHITDEEFNVFLKAAQAVGFLTGDQTLNGLVSRP